MQKKKMKKKADWLTKEKKRKIKKKDKGIVEIMMLMHHFFKEFPVWLIIPEYIKPLNRFLGATIPENESQSKSMILFQ